MTQTSQGLFEAIRSIARFIRTSNKVIVLTGAGFSTPSGIPDFRSEGSGLWTRFLPMEVASLSIFRHNPEKFFDWLRPLASHMDNANPNIAHYALTRLEKAGFIQAIVTQNIDGLHTRAGSQNVYEVHGTFNTLTCTGCYHQYKSAEFLDDFINSGKIPHCNDCSRILKPDVILFEEQLPIRIWQKAEAASRECDLMIVAGTSLEVMPSAGLPVKAVDNKARLVIINNTPTYIDVRADIVLYENVADVIPVIADEVLKE
ncbi:MAG: NAD-dependent deacylase [Chloroflexi bacterium]|nr:MAG: NAD-dependent deacylase [Chloroflexota bacterium]